MAGTQHDDLAAVIRALDAWMSADPRNRTLAQALAAFVLRAGHTQEPSPPVSVVQPPSRKGQERGSVQAVAQAMGRGVTMPAEPIVPGTSVSSIKARPARPSRPMRGGLHSTDPITRELLEAVAPELENLGVLPRESGENESPETKAAQSSGRTPSRLETFAPDAAKALAATIAQLAAAKNEGKPDGKLVGGLAQHPPSAPGVAPPPKDPAPARHADADATASPLTPPDPHHKHNLLVQRAQFHVVQQSKCYVQRDMKAALVHLQRIIDTLEEYAQLTPIAAHAPMGGVLASTIDALTPKLAVSGADEKRLAALLARMDAQEEADDGPLIHPSDASRARLLLSGKIAVIIGGDRREERQRALVSDLALRDLRWLRSQPGKASTQFEADIKRPEVTLVLLAIRWVRHGTADAVVAAARKHNKLLVRLPGGMGSNAVAHCVLTQAGAGLGLVV